MRAHERARPGTALAELAGGTLLQYRIQVLCSVPGERSRRLGALAGGDEDSEILFSPKIITLVVSTSSRVPEAVVADC